MKNWVQSSSQNPRVSKRGRNELKGKVDADAI